MMEIIATNLYHTYIPDDGHYLEAKGDGFAQVGGMKITLKKGWSVKFSDLAKKSEPLNPEYTIISLSVKDEDVNEMIGQNG